MRTGCRRKDNFGVWEGDLKCLRGGGWSGEEGSAVNASFVWAALSTKAEGGRTPTVKNDDALAMVAL